MINSPPFSIFIWSHFHFRFEFTIVRFKYCTLNTYNLWVLFFSSALPLFFVHPPQRSRSELHDTAQDTHTHTHTHTRHTHSSRQRAHTAEREKVAHRGTGAYAASENSCIHYILFKNIEICISYILNHGEFIWWCIISKRKREKEFVCTLEIFFRFHNLWLQLKIPFIFQF